VLRRRVASETVQRWRDRDGRAEAAPLYQALTAWSGPALDQLRAARPALPSQLSDRAADVWEPLLAIADLAGNAWPARGRRAAVALVGTMEDADPTIELLTDIKDIITTAEAIILTKELIEKLTAQEDRPWATWRRDDKPITARGLAGLLGPLGIHPHRHLRTARGYRVDAFADAILRYLPSQASMCHGPNEYGPESRDTNDFETDAKNANVTGLTADSIRTVTDGHIEAGDDDANYYGA